MTDVSEIAALVDGYRTWVKDRTTLKTVHADWVEISTPFLDRHNDCIQIYVKSESGSYFLNDDGHTLRDLEMSGCALDSPKRQQLLRVTLNGFGLELSNGVIATRTMAENFPARKHALIQGILAVNDLFALATSTVHSLFKEDVERWLEAADIRFLPNIQFTGKSGYQHHFDFAIPKSRTHPERIIKAVSNPNKDAALTFITAWTDTAEQRPTDAEAIAFLNDNDKKVPATVLDALEQYAITAVTWSEREKVRGRLAA